jgi:hypothetical protein
MGRAGLEARVSLPGGVSACVQLRVWHSNHEPTLSSQPTILCKSPVSSQVPNSWAAVHVRLVASGPRHVKPEPENHRGEGTRSTCLAALVA